MPHDDPGLLERADAGDVDALMTLAVRRLRGEGGPRDLAAARGWLRRAVAIGHVDGALMEIALTANGSGGPGSWSAALALLERAAPHDQIAANQLSLVQAMDVGADGAPRMPGSPDVLSGDPRVVRFPAFLTPAECGHLAAVAAEMLLPAAVLDPATGQRIVHPIRTSHDAAIGPAREDLVVRAINLRIAAATGTRVAQGEALTVLRYTPGQEYRPHLDTLERTANQRIRTAIVYLNQGYGGGETTFPRLGLTVEPGGGDLLVFDTLRSDGTPDPRALHAGRPVTRGAKWIATRWIRAADFDPWLEH